MPLPVLAELYDEGGIRIVVEAAEGQAKLETLRSGRAGFIIPLSRQRIRRSRWRIGSASVQCSLVIKAYDSLPAEIVFQIERYRRDHDWGVLLAPK